MRIKYISVFVNDMETGVDFFKNKLGFEVVNNGTINETDYTVIKVDDLFISLTVPEQGSGFKTRLILNTDDCLKDYHNLKAAGIVFKNEPQYLTVGLAAEFTDDYDNQYILLEQRNYNDV
jgi:catechol 2,3-dioxygenase-like lactoylglutathione lyase family enzyme